MSLIAGVCAAPASAVDDMFAVPYLPDDPAAVDWSALPRLNAEEGTVFRGIENVAAFNLHSYLCYYDNHEIAITEPGGDAFVATATADWFDGSSPGISDGLRQLTLKTDLSAGAWLADEVCVVSLLRSIHGDLDGDGLVGSEDLDRVRANWGRSVTPGDLDSGDANGDGIVDSGDLDVIRAAWGQSAEASAVPEPSALALITVLLFVTGTSRQSRPRRILQI